MQQRAGGFFSAGGGFSCSERFPVHFFVFPICLFLLRRSGTAHWVGSSLCRHRDSRDQGRPVITKFLGFITPASWFMSEKQDTLGCCYFIGTHTHGNTHSAWPGHGGIFIYFVCARTQRSTCTFTHTCTHTQTVSVIRPGSCCCVRGNYSMQLSKALMESFRLTGSTVRSLDSASF